MDLITDGISIILEFVDKVNKGTMQNVLYYHSNSVQDGKKVTGFDIGGGLPVNFDTDAVSPSYLDYAALLKFFAIKQTKLIFLLERKYLSSLMALRSSLSLVAH